MGLIPSELTTPDRNDRATTGVEFVRRLAQADA